MKKILVVEDDHDTFNTVEVLLKDEGYTVIRIARFISANEVAEIAPDLIIIDFLLSFGLGNELCLTIKSHERTKNIPVILYSASPHLQQIVINCKADAFIARAFDNDEFLDEIKKLIL